MKQTASVAANQPSNARRRQQKKIIDYESRSFHEMCDKSYYGVVPNPCRVHCGAAGTLINVDEDGALGEAAKFALKHYNEENGKSFVLVKVCKANCCGPHRAMTFQAKEDGTDKYRFFRCVVHGGREVLYCDVKRDGGEIKFVPDGYVGPLPACLRNRPGPARPDPPTMEQTASVAANQPSQSHSQARRRKQKKFIQMCDKCYYGDAPGYAGAAVTCINADRDKDLRRKAKLALKHYNKENGKSLVLVKVCKANCCGPHRALTFQAKEDDKCRFFRCVVGGGRRVLYCDVKNDGGEIKLVPGDVDYGSPEKFFRREHRIHS